MARRFLWIAHPQKTEKLNVLNGFTMEAKGWCLMGLLSFFSFLFGCDATSKDASKVTNFRWYAVATAPRDYPMKVISGTFYFKGESSGIGIPSGGTIHTGWGKSASVYVGGDRIPPLPDRVEVEFYSYAENQFYKAEFALPYDLILAKFQQQLKSDPERNYTNFLLGIAPGGAMSVWLECATHTVEIFFGQAEKVLLTPRDAFELPFNSKEQSDQYIESALAASVTPEQLEYIKTHGAPIGTWARYRNLYKWSPVYKDGKNPTRQEMTALYLNGERYDAPTHFSEELANTPKPLPVHIKNRIQITPEESRLCIIDFEPFELMEAFEKLGANGEKVFIEFDAQVPRQNMKIRVYNDTEPKDAKTPKEVIELKKFKVDPER